MRILLIEDNARLAEYISSSLNRLGMQVDCFNSGKDGIAAIEIAHYDAVVLDLGLPDIDGMNVLTNARKQGIETPILILTARDGLKDRVDGLNAGADDYLLKPFEIEELDARIRALMRRPGGTLGSQLSYGNVEFDTVARNVLIEGSVVAMSRRETDILEYLLRRAGRVISKSWLEDAIYRFDDEGSSNSVEVAVHRLRKRLQAAEANVQIHTLRGIGYMLQK